MTKIDVTKTELVWPGKYNDDGTRRETPRASLPFQIIEAVNESRATREAQKNHTMSLFDVYEGKEGDTFEAGWRNKLIWGDNLLVENLVIWSYGYLVTDCFNDQINDQTTTSRDNQMPTADR